MQMARSIHLSVPPCNHTTSACLFNSSLVIGVCQDREVQQIGYITNHTASSIANCA